MVDKWIVNNGEQIIQTLKAIASQQEGEGPVVYAELAINEAYLYGYIAALKNSLTIEDMEKLDKHIEMTSEESTYCHYLYIKNNTENVELNLF